jgi:hypothetical protein
VWLSLAESRWLYSGYTVRRAKVRMMQKLLGMIFSRENIYAVLLCLILIAILIMTADQAPQWIYQGF